MKKLFVLGVGLAAGVAPVAAAQAAAVETSTVSRSVSVAPGASRSLTLRCPGTSVALNGAATTGLGTLTDSLPRAGTRRWTFRFSSRGGRRRATAVLRCVRLALPAGVRGVRLTVGTALQREIEVDAGTTKRVAVDCPFGQIATGWGLERVVGDASLGVAAAVARSNGWVFKLENGGQSPAKVSPHIRCLGRTQRALTGERHRFSMRRASFSDRVQRGSGGATHACREGEFSVATGVSIAPAAELFMTGTYPLGQRGGRWGFRQPSASSRVKTVLLCLDQGTGFR